VDQDGAPCTFRINPTSSRISRDEQDVSVSVETPEGCDWSVRSDDGWIDVNGGSNRSGPGAVRLTVKRNKDRNERTGTVRIAGEVFSVVQAGGSADDTVGNLGSLVDASSLPR
jgi:hypothetical protein